MIPPFIKWLIGHILPHEELAMADEIDDGFSTQKVESGDVVEDSITVGGHTYMVRGFRCQQFDRCKAFINYVNDDRLNFTYHECAIALSVVRSDTTRTGELHETATQNLDVDTRPIGRSDYGGGVG